MSVRLPTVGQGAAGHDGEPGIVRPVEARADAPVPTIALVAAVPTGAALHLAERLVAATRARRVSIAALVVGVRQGEATVEDAGFPDGSAPGRLAAAGAAPVRWVRGAPEALQAPLRAAFEGLPEGRWCVSVGHAVPALLRPRLTVLLTAGAARPAFSAAARGLLDRVDVELTDPRPGFADGLATLL